MTPVATLTNLTATGDVITAVGSPTRLCKGIPQACVGDMVTGPMCTGTLSVSTATTRIMMGRPEANISTMVTGVNPITGIPMTTTIAVSPNVDRLV